jgi:HPt (histidine-containing phosphotransfer) domain-containing protein
LAEHGAHSLKSSSANIGAESVRAVATEIEAAARESQMDQVGSLLPRMEELYASAIAALEILEREFPPDEQ